MRTIRFALAVSGLSAAVAGADGAADLSRRLEAFHTPGPVAATLRLELRLERTLHHQNANGQASVRLDVDEDDRGTHVVWEPTVLREADAEEREHDAAPERLLPVREALKELDPLRLDHLLDQAGTVTGLTKGPPAEESAESYEGHDARRLAWTDAYYLKHSEGRFTIWIGPDGTPIASESLATFEGKTSRMFGRFKGTTRISTRYAVEGGRLRVAQRDVDEADSREDGGE